MASEKKVIMQHKLIIWAFFVFFKGLVLVVVAAAAIFLFSELCLFFPFLMGSGLVGLEFFLPSYVIGDEPET